MEISKKLGEQIRTLRTNKDMSQESLALSASLAPAHLGQIERATKNATIETIAKIAAALGVTVADLFDFDMPPKITASNTLEKINCHLSNMSDEQLKDILKIVKIMSNYMK